MRSHLFYSVVLCYIGFSLPHPLLAEDAWPSWRGPHGDGTAPTGSFATVWNESTNVVWKLDLPGPGSSTPAIWRDQIFLTHEKDDRNIASSLDLEGRVLWSVDLGGYQAGKHKKATGCNSSPVTDGTHVYFYFKSGDLACITMTGETVWHVNLQQEYGNNTLWWDLGTSPVLTKDHVVVAVQQEGPSFIVALNQKTGEQAWKRDRTFQVPQEAEQSYTTPIVTTFDGREQIVVLGADHLTAHDAQDGSELWRVGDLNPEQQQYFRSIASATRIDDMIVAPYARGDTLTAVRLGGQGDVTDSHVAWTREADSSDVPTPANFNGQIIVCTDKGKVLCIDTKTGDEVWSTSLPKSRETFSASPVIAGKHIYVTREDGTTFVLDTSGELVSTNELPTFVVATPVFHDGRVYVRGLDVLYCIGD